MSNNKVGESLTFFQLYNEKNNRIKIPILQRDYAQGRPSAEGIRHNFLKAIKKNLDESKPLNLDFVYGSVVNNDFIPLDGQQRLTTLFLLHWYLANQSNQLNHFTSWMQDENGSKFSYDTRISSKDFCNKLVSCELPEESTKPSDFIINQSWFYLHWKKDPTVTAMLNTIDSIATIFDGVLDYYAILTENLNSISFEFIELSEFGLTDQLYIKMNARGIPLTIFENLKANVEEVFSKQDKLENTNNKEWFTVNVDGKWTDFFWGLRREDLPEVDQMMMNFIQVSITNMYAMTELTIEKGLASMVSKNEEFNYYTLQTWELNNDYFFKRVFQYIDRLNDFYEEEENIRQLNEILPFQDILESAIQNDISFPNRILHCAVWEYLIQHPFDQQFIKWIRIIRNLVENSRVDEIDNYNAAMNSIRFFLEDPLAIEELVKNYEGRVLEGFSGYQTKEEKIKTELLAKYPEIRETIYQIENHKYLKGHIMFLLEFADIHIVYEDESEELFDPDDKEEVFKKLNYYYDRFQLVFGDSGIKKINKYRIERALLSIDDYTLKKSRNYSFLINGSDREISWKRFLRTENNICLKELLDLIESDDLKLELDKIIESSEVPKDDWRYYFIKYPEIINNCGRFKFFRFYDDDHIYLLEKTQTNGMHREYYSFAVKCELESLGYEVEYIPECYEEDFTKYISKINGKSIKVYYHYGEDDNGYWLEYRGKNRKKVEENIATHDEVIEFVTNLIEK